MHNVGWCLRVKVVCNVALKIAFDMAVLFSASHKLYNDRSLDLCFQIEQFSIECRNYSGIALVLLYDAL